MSDDRRAPTSPAAPQASERTLPQLVLGTFVEEYVHRTNESVSPDEAADVRAGYHAVRVGDTVHVSRDTVEISTLAVADDDTRCEAQLLEDAIWLAANADARWLRAEMEHQRDALNDGTRAWWDQTLDSNSIYTLLIDTILSHLANGPHLPTEIAPLLRGIARETVERYREDIAESVYCHAIVWTKLAIRRQYADDELERIDQNDLDAIFAGELPSGTLVRDAIQYTLNIWEADLVQLLGELPEVRSIIEEASGVKPTAAVPRLAKRTPAPSVSFNAPALTFLNDPHTQAVIRSMWDMPNWRPGEEETLDYLHDGVRVYLPSRPSHGGSTLDATWQRVLELDDSTASTFLICIGKWFADSGGEHQHLPKTRVHVADILGFRGIKKHVNGGYRPEQKEETRRHILALNDIWVQSDDDIFQSRGRKKRVRVDSRLLEVSLESEPGSDGEFEPYAFRIAPGEWARSYLGPHNRVTAQLLQPVMKYDPYRQRMAMRLGIYLASQWRIRASSRNYAQPWRVSTMLNGACLDLPSRNLQRFRDQFENALDQLQDDEVIAGWEYERDSELPLRHWFPLWLDWTVRVTPPEAILDHYAPIASGKTKAIGEARRAGAAASKWREKAQDS